MDDDWLERDLQIVKAAGKNSHFSGAGVGDNQCAGRDHGWEVKTIEEAKALKARLDKVPLVKCTIREK
jgi:hypothetical protein